MTDIVITGTGLLSAAGRGAEPAFAALRDGQGLFSEIVIGEASGAKAARVPVGRVDPALAVWPSSEPWWLNSRKFATPSGVWAVDVVRQAVARAGLTASDAPERGGVVVASANGGEEELAKALPHIAKLLAAGKGPVASLLYDYVPDFSYVRDIPSQAGQFVARAANFLGSNLAVFGEANIGGLSALALGMRMVESEEVDRVVVVGVASPTGMGTLRRLYEAGNVARAALPGRGPFDRGRQGTFIGEGAAAIVIERAEAAARRGAAPLARLRACETCCMLDAAGAARAAAEFALARGRGAADLWWATGSGSSQSDSHECGVLSELHRGAVTSSKSGLGNAFEAAGLIDVVLAVEALRARLAPAIPLLETPDARFAGIDFVMSRPRPLPDDCDILVTAFGGAVANAASAAGAALLGGVSRQ